MKSRRNRQNLDRFGIYIIGAGFSCHAGLPLATELWSEVRRRAASIGGRALHFHRDVETYIEFKRTCDRVRMTPKDIDFEEFLGFLDIEYHLGLRGSDTWSLDGNETQVLVKTLIGQILAERTASPADIPPLYLRFAEKLRPNDLILTFNYDVLMERALETVGVPYRLFPVRFKSVNASSGLGECDDSRDEVRVLKLHGSVDWFDRRQFTEQEEQFKAYQLPPPEHPLFNSPQAPRLMPLVDGPRFPNDPLTQMYRVVDLEKAYTAPQHFSVIPSLILPSTSKVIYARQFGDFWNGLGRAGSMNLRMVIVGFSLPKHDEYAKQVLYRLVRNYQQMHWNKPLLGTRKERIMLVDFRPTKKGQNELRRRYSFVKWRRAEAFFDGFNDQILAKL